MNTNIETAIKERDKLLNIARGNQIFKWTGNSINILGE